VPSASASGVEQGGCHVYIDGRMTFAHVGAGLFLEACLIALPTVLVTPVTALELPFLNHVQSGRWPRTKAFHQGFDKLSPNGKKLSPSGKMLSPNGK
jgi:hypothetical protein